MYRLSAFYLARTASDLPMELSLPAGYLLITYFMGGAAAGGERLFCQHAGHHAHHAGAPRWATESVT